MRTEYARLRAKGWHAKAAYEAAKINARFAEVERLGLAEIRIEDDCEPYDASYIDTWEDVPVKERERYKRDLEHRLDAYGAVIIALYVRGEMVDCIGGFIGDDTADNGYDTDLKRQAIEALGWTLCMRRTTTNMSGPLGRCHADLFRGGPVLRADVSPTAPGSAARANGVRWYASLWTTDNESVGFLDAPRGHKTPRELLRELAQHNVPDVRVHTESEGS